MKYLKQTKLIAVFFSILVFFCLYFVLRNDKEVSIDPIDEILDAMPTAPEGSSRNEKIKIAFDTFQKLGEKYRGEFQELCKGGFINTEEKRLKEVADEIISNRVINYHPLEFAFGQDEAGITCLSTEEKWVLFSALNTEDESDKNYFCVDSTKRKGNYALNRDKISCGN